MDRLIFAIYDRAKVAGPVALAALAVLLFATAPTKADRYTAAVVLFSLGACGFVTARSISYAARVVARDDALIDETLRRVSGIIERLSANPRTAAGGQEAMDAVRNIWGERADEWLGKSDLN